jgi:hypothetical protein
MYTKMLDIFSSYEDYKPTPDDDEDTPSPIDKSLDTTDIQGS